MIQKAIGIENFYGFDLFGCNVFGIDQGESAGVAFGFQLLVDASADHAKIAVRRGGIQIEGVGQAVKAQNLVALVIVLVKSVFLLEAEPLSLAVGKTNLDGGVGAEVKIKTGGSSSHGGGGGSVAVGKPRLQDFAAECTQGDKFPKAEEEKSQQSGGKDPYNHAPAHHATLGRIGLVVVVVGKGTCQAKGHPKDPKQNALDVVAQHQAAQSRIFFGDL